MGYLEAGGGRDGRTGPQVLDRDPGVLSPLADRAGARRGPSPGQLAVAPGRTWN